MTWMEKFSIVVVMVLVMEATSWVTPCYVMHGWGWHRSHHELHDRAFEKNDLYAAVFSVVVLFAVGMDWEPLWWIAVGISCYGAIYFFVHNMLVHQRFGLLQAHRLHHAVSGSDGAVSFGVLIAPSPTWLKQRLRERARG